MPLQVGIEEGSRSTAVCASGLQYCQYSQKKINLVTLMSDLVCAYILCTLTFRSLIWVSNVYYERLAVPFTY
jgi:hypothetical protein